MSGNRTERAHKRFGRLEERIGYTFSHYDHLERALTHASARKKSSIDFHYERLEFLGDRVLGLAVTHILFEHFPEASEGELSLRLNSLVNTKTLVEIADEMKLHEFIRTGGDLKTLTGRQMQSVRADVLEALICSIFLDGGLEPVTDFITRFWRDRLSDDSAARRDSKTELQEWAHANQFGTPSYKEKTRSGPDHDPVFTVTVRVGDLGEAEGTGRSKRLAEQAAAAAILVREGVWSSTEAAG